MRVGPGGARIFISTSSRSAALGSRHWTGEPAGEIYYSHTPEAGGAHIFTGTSWRYAALGNITSTGVPGERARQHAACKGRDLFVLQLALSKLGNRQWGTLPDEWTCSASECWQG